MIENCFVKKDNVIVCKLPYVDYVNELPENAKVIGEVSIDYFENCVLMSGNKIIDDNLLRIEYTDHARGVKIGYLEVSYNEFVVLKSIWKQRVRFYFWSILMLIICDVFIYVGCYL